MADVAQAERSRALDKAINHYKNINRYFSDIVGIVKLDMPQDKKDIQNFLKSIGYNAEDLAEFNEVFGDEGIFLNTVADLEEVQKTLTSQIPQFAEQPGSSLQIPQDTDVNELVPQSEAEMGGPQEEEIGAPDLTQEEPMSM